MVAAAVVVGLVGLVGMVRVADAVTVINNWCTGTYQLTGKVITSSGIDSAVVRALNPPVITITKIATNVRTGASDGYSVAAVQGDSVEFKMIWANAGEATADTVVLNDYIPAGMTYVGASVSDTEANAAGAASENAGLVQYVATAAGGTDTAAADGIVKFQATVN
ncbi:hypothetical protein AUJ67_01675 [Candidatus Desantisbacteria bacterium CG1_02_49_89]|nr:MAG: hypothetical protein AUJ67_01675 [Candidatus Desantisbacteria bacterium CG1_02_49_89]